MRTFAIAAILLASAAAVAHAPTAHHGLGLGTDYMDRSVKAGDDFDRYANGAWQKRTEIPADRTRLSSFVLVQDVVDQRTTDLIANAAAANPPAGTDARKIADFYAAYLDQDTIDKRGLAPLQPIFQRIDAAGNVRDFSSVLGSMMRTDVDPINATNLWTENLFGLFVTQSLEQPEKVVPYLMQGGLGMPNRAYYLSENADMARIRTAYRGYVAAMLTALGRDSGEARADCILALETAIAKVHADPEEAQDPAHVQAWSRDDYAAKAPGVDWSAYFDAAQLGGQPQVMVWHPAAITGISALVASQPLEVWKDWLMLHTASRYAAMLPRKIDDLRFSFYGTALSGQQVQRTRQRRAVMATSTTLSGAVGQAYVGRYFPASARKDVEGMVHNIIAAFDTRLAANKVLAPTTRDEARRKLKTLIVGVGYPDRWRDYSTLEIKPDDAFGNSWRASELEYRNQLAKIARPADRNEWWMAAQLVNAINLPLQNAIDFPAGILNPPFYDPAADAAFNYGAIGSVIGHEISHSFDNLGAGFDADGKLRNWWTPEDLARFKAAGKALASQYDTYEAFPGVHINGQLTLGENIADLAGLTAAYDAYHASLGGKPAPVIGGLTGDQRFFLAYAQAHRAKYREAALRQQIATNEHAPDQYRTLTVRNLDAWYSAFAVKKGDKLYLTPAERVRVW